MGDPIADRYAANLRGVEVIPVFFSIQAKSDIYKRLDREIRSRRLSIPAGPNTRRTRVYRRWRTQMEDLEKDYRGSYMCCQAPPDDPDAHDDFSDSLALCIHAAYSDSMPEVEMGMSSLIGGRTARTSRRNRNPILR